VIEDEAAKWEANGPIKKGLLSRNIYSKRESWTTALRLTNKGKRQLARENTTLNPKPHWLRFIHILHWL
jgi:hypothetical protein